MESRQNRANIEENLKTTKIKRPQQKDHVSVCSHAANQVIADGDVSDLAHFLRVHWDSLPSLRVRVQDVRLRTQEPKETEHVFKMPKLFAADTCRNKFRRTRGISSISLPHRSPHHRSTVHVKNKTRNTLLQLSDCERSIGKVSTTLGPWGAIHRPPTVAGNQFQWRNVDMPVSKHCKTNRLR